MREPERMAREIRLRAQQKEEKIQQNLEEKRMKELEECTFTPKPFKPPPNWITTVQDTVPIIGMERHLELRDLANRKKALNQQRIDEVFGRKNSHKVKTCIHGTTLVEVYLIFISSRQYVYL